MVNICIFVHIFLTIFLVNNIMSLEKKINDSYNKLDDIGSKINEYYPTNRITKNNKDGTLIVSQDGDLVLNCKYTYVGSYDVRSKIWMWSYNNFSLLGSDKSFKEKLLKFKKDLLKDMNDYKDIKYVEKIYNYLSNEVFLLSHKSVHDLVKLCLHVLGGNGMMGHENSQSGLYKIDFYIIRDILVNNVVENSTKKPKPSKSGKSDKPSKSSKK